jgi:hypothetical protein
MANQSIREGIEQQPILLPSASASAKRGQKRLASAHHPRKGGQGNTTPEAGIWQPRRDSKAATCGQKNNPWADTLLQQESSTQV